MDGAAVKELATRFRGPEVIDGFISVPQDWQLHDPASLVKAAPAAKAMPVSTLKSLVDYVKANRDGLALDKVLVHIESPTRVTIGGPLRDRSRDRELYLTAIAIDMAEPFLGKWLSTEDFIIGLQLRFVADNQSRALLRLLSNVSGETVSTSMDDGISQVLETRAGVVLKGSTPIQNPLALAPFRTFREVDQPVSPFVLRAKSGSDLPLLTLLEADGGAWRLAAIEHIRAYLAKELPAEVALLA